MKILLGILLLANVVFFAVMHWGGPLEEQVAKPQPALHEEKINLISTSPDNLPTAPASSVVEAATLLKCTEWGDFSGVRLKQANDALSALQLGDKLVRHQVEISVNYWVFIPPVKNKAVLAKQIAQLKLHGVNDYFVVTKPANLLNTISLGVFRTQEAAQHFLDDLQRTKGINNAKIGEKVSKINVTRFVFDGLDAKASQDLANIQKDFPGSELNEAPCALTR